MLGTPLLVGRSKGKCDIIIKDPKVSREHVRLDASDTEHISLVCVDTSRVPIVCTFLLIFSYFFFSEPPELVEHR